jgi:hypothetical protein
MPRPSAGARGPDDDVWLAPAVPVPDLADCLESFYDNRCPLPQPVPGSTGTHPDAVLLELDEAPVDIGGRSLTDVLRPAYPAMADAARHRITGP